MQDAQWGQSSSEVVFDSVCWSNLESKMRNVVLVYLFGGLQNSYEITSEILSPLPLPERIKGSGLE